MRVDYYQHMKVVTHVLLSIINRVLNTNVIYFLSTLGLTHLRGCTYIGN